MKDIQDTTSGKGQLRALILDLADFPTIGIAVNTFLSKENRLDALVHNAGLMTPPAGSKSKLDLEMATNCLGPFLLNRLLEPILIKTAEAESANSGRVRIVWVASMITVSVPPGGIQFEKSGRPKVLKNAMQNYMQSKVGNVFLASETAKRLGEKGVISLVGQISPSHTNLHLTFRQSVNPGLMKTELQRHSPKIQSVIMVRSTYTMLNVYEIYIWRTFQPLAAF